MLVEVAVFDDVVSLLLRLMGSQPKKLVTETFLTLDDFEDDFEDDATADESLMESDIHVSNVEVIVEQ